MFSNLLPIFFSTFQAFFPLLYSHYSSCDYQWPNPMVTSMASSWPQQNSIVLTILSQCSLLFVVWHINTSGLFFFLNFFLKNFYFNGDPFQTSLRTSPFPNLQIIEWFGTHSWVLYFPFIYSLIRLCSPMV